MLYYVTVRCPVRAAVDASGPFQSYLFFYDDVIWRINFDEVKQSYVIVDRGMSFSQTFQHSKTGVPDAAFAIRNTIYFLKGKDLNKKSNER